MTARGKRGNSEIYALEHEGFSSSISMAISKRGRIKYWLCPEGG
jgi:hypothetical protein